MSDERGPRHARITSKLVACGLVGVALILSTHLTSYADLARGLVEELGKALVVAFIVGMIIDQALKRDLVRDAVEASIGYLLPEQLRNEMHWVYGKRLSLSKPGM